MTQRPRRAGLPGGPSASTFSGEMGLAGILKRWAGRLLARRQTGSGKPGGRHGALGRRGERLAERRLRRMGYRILARNFRAAGAEIDLVALDGTTLVFLEVKTRLSLSAGRPEEAVDSRKQLRLRRAAQAYLARQPLELRSRPVRFDVAALTQSGLRTRLALFKDAFR